jgi:hypothetical protein
LFDRLEARFGTGNVFMDVDSIEPGLDFAETVEEAIDACDVLLVLIGPHWANAVDEHGRRRLEDPDDFVALEITTALRRRIRVIPVLVDGAPPPRRGDLPEALATLARRQGVRLEHTSFGAGLAMLMTALERALHADKRKPADQPQLIEPQTEGRATSGRYLAVEAPVSTSDRGRQEMATLEAGHHDVAELCEQTRSVAEAAALLNITGRPSDITRDLMRAADEAPHRPKRWKGNEARLIKDQCLPDERVIGVDFFRIGREWCAAAVTNLHLFLAQDKEGRVWRQQLEPVPESFRINDEVTQTVKVIRIPIAKIDGPLSAGGTRLSIYVHDARGPIWSSRVTEGVGARLDALLDRLAGAQRHKSAQREERERLMQEALRSAAMENAHRMIYVPQ